MRFCMVTTFFGSHSFGGDAVYVDHLSRALLRRGHLVDVVYTPDAFNLLRGKQQPHAYTPPKGLRIRPLSEPLGAAWSFWTHQTGGLGPRRRSLQRILNGGHYDVIHYHNVSLIGGPAALLLDDPGMRAVRVMTVHDYWLLCALSVLWRSGGRVCDRPQCVRCSIRAGRPPQFWRHSDVMTQALERLDALIFPSAHSLSLHRSRAIRARHMVGLPCFLPSDWPLEGGKDDTRATGGSAGAARPYFMLAGRLVPYKGFQDVIRLMERLPQYDLRIAGAGPMEAELRGIADSRNVHFLGRLDASDLVRTYRGALALIVPSLFDEPFGYVVLEALSLGTPAIVRHAGALPELIDDGVGGVIFRNTDELLAAMTRVAADDGLRRELGQRGREAVQTRWSEDAHMARYLALIERCRGSQPVVEQPHSRERSRGVGW